MSRESTKRYDPKPATEDIDVYCLTCGYNLRGLSGDPRRCPECGNLNPMGDLELPAQLITAQLRRMETAPTVCAGAFLFSLVWFLLWFTILSKGIDYIDSEIVMGTGLPLLSSMAFWFGGMLRFRSACLGKEGWWPLIWRYHFLTLFLAGLIVLIIDGGPYLAFRICDYDFFQEQDKYFGLYLLLSVVTVIPVIFILGRRLHRRIKEDMDTLQREVAVKLARQRLQRDLHDARRNK